MSTHYKLIQQASTELVLDTTKPSWSNDAYIGDVWHDDEMAEIARRPYWNINNGTVYLWGLTTKEEAIEMITGMLK